MNNKILYIKYIRNLNDDSQSALSKKINKNKFYISEIESYKRNLTDNIFREIISVYNIDYNDDENVEKDISNLIKEYVIAAIKKETTTEEKIIKTYKSNLNLYKHSKGFIYTFLMDFIISYGDDIKCNNDKCLEYIKYYTNDFYFYYAIMYVFKYDIYENEKEIDEIFHYCLKEKSTYGLNPAVAGMFYYQLGRLYDAQGNYFKSYDMCLKGIELFDKVGIYERSLQAKIQIAGLYLSLKMFDICEKEYLELYDISLKAGFSYRAGVCANNLAYLYIIKKEFDKAGYYAKKSLEINTEFNHINYYKYL